MQTLSEITGVPQVIQVALAPVFLIFGVGPILSVLVKRLGRVVDRLRILESSLPVHDPAQTYDQGDEMAILLHRARLIHLAIGLCAGGALLIGVVIAVLIVSAIIELEMPGPITTLAIMTVASFCAGLICFLRDIALDMACIPSCHADAGHFSR